MRAVDHIQSLPKQRRNRSQDIEKRQTTTLTGKIHNVVIKFDFGPVFEHRLERGTGTFRSFRLRDRHDFVWVYDGIGTLRKGIEKNKVSII